MDYLKDIIAEIQDEKCVLIIGPDIIDFGQKTFFEALCEALKSNEEYDNIVDSPPQYIFSNEELFQPVSERYEGNLQEMMEDFYKQQIGFTIPLTQITQIPFHLIISLMPDDRLQNLFKQQFIAFNYGYYPKAGAAAPPVPKPERSIPLVYNLLGDFNHSQAIVTFDDLFDFLSNIMGKKNLPSEIELALANAKSFLFLGVNFEKWYAQILLRKLISKADRRKKYTSLKKEGTNEVYTFISRRLNLKLFQTNPQEFLKDLYTECSNQEILRRQGFKKTVFISYSSKDETIAEKLEKILIQNQIGVIRDVSSSYAGQKIEQFIGTIKNVDGALLILSKDSLRSYWVCKEIITTLDQQKDLYSFYIDKQFLEDSYWLETDEMIKEKLNSIGRSIGERGASSIEDLIELRSDWTNFNNALPRLKSVLTRGVSKSLMPEEFDETVQQLVKTLSRKRND